MRLTQMERGSWLSSCVRPWMFDLTQLDFTIPILREMQTARLSTMWRVGSRTEGLVDGDFYRYFQLEHNGLRLPYIEIFDQVTKQGMLVGVWDTRLYDVHEAYEKALSDTKLYKTAFERCGGDFYFPILYKDQFKDPDDLVRNHTGKMQFTSHLLGEKSKQVSWQSMYVSNLDADYWSDMMRLANQHSDAYHTKNEMPPHQIEYDWTNYATIPLTQMVYAVDNRRDSHTYRKMVAAMALLTGGDNTINADSVGRLYNDNLKPYSLISVALVYAAVTGLMTHAAINLGLNFEETEYKGFLPITKKPLLNLPFFNYRAPVEEIEALLLREAG